MKISLLLVAILVIINSLLLAQKPQKLQSKIDSLTKVENELNTKLNLIKKEKFKLNLKLNSLKAKENLKNSIQTKTKNLINLYVNSDLREKVLEAIPHNKIIHVLDYYSLSGSWKISYNNKTGFVTKHGIEMTPEMLALVKEYDDKLKLVQKDDKIRLQNKRKKKILNKYGNKIGKKILEGKIWLGMTKEMARESWGKPNDINRTVGSFGVHEQWVYGSPMPKYLLYFENGKLNSWQEM